MRSPLLVSMASIALLSAAPAQAASPHDPDVWDYAKKCFDRIGLKNHDDLKGPFDCKDPKRAKRLTTQVDGHVKDKGICDPKKGSCPTTFPSKCDYPAWLELSSKHCYGNSYVQEIPTPSNSNITAAMLCRHKRTWSDGNDDFEDIAMIVHNEKNGETCWFQTDDSPGIKLKGSAVPGPETVRDHSFWLRPVDTARVGCIGCHDNGPFMNSRWMDRAIYLPDDSTAPYKNSEPPFDTWPEPRFVDAGKNPKKGGECTSCHKIAAGGIHKVAIDRSNPAIETTIHFETCRDCNKVCRGAPLSPKCRRCRGWIQRVTGRTNSRTHPKGANAKSLSDDLAIWMPDIGGTWKRSSWNKAYKRYVEHLMKCCDAVGKTKPGDKVKLEDCSEFVPTVQSAFAAADGGDDGKLLASRSADGDRPIPPGFPMPSEAELAAEPEEPEEEPEPDPQPVQIPADTDELPAELQQTLEDAVEFLKEKAQFLPRDARLDCWLDKLADASTDDRVIPWTRICPHQGANEASNLICRETSLGEAALAGISGPDGVQGANDALQDRKFIVRLKSDAVRKGAFMPLGNNDLPDAALVIHHMKMLGEDVALADQSLSAGGVSAAGYAGIKAWIDARKADPKSVYQCENAPKTQSKDCKWNSMDVIDPRIDTDAQQSLMRMLRTTSPAPVRAEGSAMLGAVKNETLAGILRPFRPLVAERAKALGKAQGAELVPSGRDATCVTGPAGAKPLIVHRDGLGEDRLDRALSDAWKACGLPTPPPCDYEVVLKPGACSTHEECREKELGWACVQHECVECAESLHCEEQGLSHKPLCDTSISTCVPFGLEISADPPPVCQRCGVPDVPVCPESTRCSPSTKCCENISQQEHDCIDRAVKKKFAARKKCQATEIEGIKQCVDDSRKCAGIELPPKPFDEDCFDVFESCVAKNPRFNKLECEKQAEDVFRREEKACRA